MYISIPPEGWKPKIVDEGSGLSRVANMNQDDWLVYDYFGQPIGTLGSLRNSSDLETEIEI